MAKARDIKFKYKRKETPHIDLLPGLNHAQLNNILTKIYSHDQLSTIMAVTPPYNQLFLPEDIQASPNGNLCRVSQTTEYERLEFCNFFNECNVNKTITELRQLASKIKITYTEEDIE